MKKLMCCVVLFASCRSVTQESVPTTIRVDEVQVVPLRNASAKEMADMLTVLMGDARRATSDGSALGSADWPTPAPQARFVADARTNSLLILAGREDQARIRELVSKLDVHVQ